MTRQMSGDRAVIVCDGCGREFEHLGYDRVEGFAGGVHQGQAVEFCPDCIRHRGGTAAIGQPTAPPAPSAVEPTAEEAEAAGAPLRELADGEVDSGGRGDYARKAGGKR